MKEYVKRRSGRRRKSGRGGGEGDEGIRHEEEREMKGYVKRRRGR